VCACVRAWAARYDSRCVLQILGAVCVGLIGAYINNSAYGNPIDMTEVLFFLLIATAFLITTTCLLLSSLLSFISASMIHKTLFVSIYSVRHGAVTTLHRQIVGVHTDILVGLQ
jgi:hypothetical protein